jgi:predicted N-formylglutamate amidohydrolase
MLLRGVHIPYHRVLIIYSGGPKMEEVFGEDTGSLLLPDEPAATHVVNPAGAAPFLLVADHAGNRVPTNLAGLGLPAAERDRHIGWDIGIGAVADRLARELDAVLIRQTYSRLVIDCNRPPAAETSIPAVSDGTEIPGNRVIGRQERAARQATIFDPYHARIARELDARAATGEATVLVALHSFTPRFDGFERPWHAAVLYRHDPRLGHALRDLMRREPGLCIGDNEPYSVSEDTDYTIPIHGERRGLLHVAIELRQDLIAEPAGQAAWAARLARLLPLACNRARDGEPLSVPTETNR